MTAEPVWLLFRSEAAPAAFNMACDEALLESIAGVGCPVLRFYAWTAPAASFGYSQRYADVCGWTLLRPLVRRPTGGGLVPHDADWTYSFVVPPGHWWHALQAVESYRAVHEWIAAAFDRLGVPATLSPSRRGEVPGQCFAGAERHDVLWHGRKVAGAAQRRNRAGLLIQGSVQPPPLGLSRSAWEGALLESAAARWGVRWEPWIEPPSFAGRVRELVETRYGREEHLRRR